MEFCVRLASEVIVNEINENPDKNFVMSPLSLNCLLNLIASGATGPTLEQLLGFLQCESIADLNAHSSLMIDLATLNKETDDRSLVTSPMALYRSKREPKLSYVCGIWMDHKFGMKPSFLQTAKDVHKADVRVVDFKSQSKQLTRGVNKWAENETKGLIKELLPSGCIDEETELALANALYFKADWFHSFGTSNTSNKDFHLLNGETIQVPFMCTRYEFFFCAQFEGFKVLKLRYAEGKDKKQFSMFFFLPDKKNGLQQLIENLDSQSILLKKNLVFQEIKLSEVLIPKFRFSYGFEASNVIQNLGLTLPFMLDANLTEMVYSPESLYVKSMFHKSFISVNEQGTEAAAFTLCRLKGGGGGSPPPLPSFVADHPFLFMIKEEVSGAIVFIGAVLNPLKED